MSPHPYSSLPDHAFWRRAVAEPDMPDVDPVVATTFQITTEHRVATAGSCFAQHIARHLREAGFNFLVTEPAHPIVSRAAAEAHGYGLFTARYGNVYTSRQLLQLFQRAYGTFTPAEDVWHEPDGRLTDPFRPQIQPGRFLTMAEYAADRERHFACVREAFETLDVLVFTLGLTECWRSREDGATYPLCPGVAGGTYDEAKYEYANLTAAEIATDLLAFTDALAGVNPAAQILLTVSPVPLIATAEDHHVLLSTTYSKAALRVAAEEVARARDRVSYFPSFEIITGAFNRGRYFAADCRSVTEEGVSHVMRTFMRHYAGENTATRQRSSASAEDSQAMEMQRLVKIVCDEEALDR